ncbi:MAG: hypothetical protein V7682_08765 [Cycloclasticus sp.]
MSTDIDLYIKELRRTITVAGLNYEIWWVYKGQDTRPMYVKTINKYGLFFETSLHAHFVALIVELYRLYEIRNDTFNIPKLLKILKAEGLLPEATLKLLDVIYKNEARPLWLKVNTLRNNVFAHRSIAHTPEKAFQKADVAPAELRDLMEVTKKLLNELTHTWDKSTHAFNLGAREDALRLLDDFKGMKKC